MTGQLIFQTNFEWNGVTSVMLKARLHTPAKPAGATVNQTCPQKSLLPIYQSQPLHFSSCLVANLCRELVRQNIANLGVFNAVFLVGELFTITAELFSKQYGNITGQRHLLQDNLKLSPPNDTRTSSIKAGSRDKPKWRCVTSPIMSTKCSSFSGSRSWELDML